MHLYVQVVAARQSQSQQQQLSLVDVLKEGRFLWEFDLFATKPKGFTVVLKRAGGELGAIFMKHGRKGNPHPRFVRLNARGNAIEWMSPDLRGPIRVSVSPPRMRLQLLSLSLSV